LLLVGLLLPMWQDEEFNTVFGIIFGSKLDFFSRFYSFVSFG